MKHIVISAAVLGLSITTTAFANCQLFAGRWAMSWPDRGDSKATMEVEANGKADYSYKNSQGGNTSGTLEGECSVGGRLFTGTWTEQRGGHNTGPFAFLINSQRNIFQGAYSWEANPHSSNDWIGSKLRQ